MDDFERGFHQRGRSWAEKMLARLRTRTGDIPHVWPGTWEQARIIVNALTDEGIDQSDRERLVAIVQNSARAAWRELAGDS